MSWLTNVAQPFYLAKTTQVYTRTPNLYKFKVKREVETKEQELEMLQSAMVDTKVNTSLKETKKLIEKLPWGDEEHLSISVEKANIHYKDIKFFNSCVREFVLDKVSKSRFGKIAGNRWAHVSLEFSSQAEFFASSFNKTSLYLPNGKISQQNEIAVAGYAQSKSALITLVERNPYASSEKNIHTRITTGVVANPTLRANGISYDQINEDYLVSQHRADYAKPDSKVYDLGMNNFYITDFKDKAGRDVVVKIEATTRKINFKDIDGKITHSLPGINVFILNRSTGELELVRKDKPPKVYFYGKNPSEDKAKLDNPNNANTANNTHSPVTPQDDNESLTREEMAEEILASNKKRYEQLRNLRLAEFFDIQYLGG